MYFIQKSFVCKPKIPLNRLPIRSGLKAPAEPSCRPKKFIFQYHHLWRFFKNKYYLKSSHRLKTISGRLIMIVNSYNLILIAISLRLIKMSINRPECGL